MNLENVIEVPYRIKFTNKNPVPVEKLVESLLAYEKLIKRVSPFIETACEGVSIADIEVFISKIESGSVVEELLVRLVFKDKANYEQAKEVAAKMFENNRLFTSVVCVGVAAYIFFGVKNAVINEKGATAQTPHIEAQQGAIVQTGGTMNISEEALNKILNNTRDKKALSKEAIAAIAPAHLEEAASIEFNDAEDLKITPAFVKESPQVYEPPELLKDNEVLLNTPIEIWASDKDSSTKSWAGIVPGKIEKRIKFVLDEAVNPNTLHGHRSVNADIKIVNVLPKDKKEFEPKRVEILKVYKQIKVSNLATIPRANP